MRKSTKDVGSHDVGPSGSSRDDVVGAASLLPFALKLFVNLRSMPAPARIFIFTREVLRLSLPRLRFRFLRNAHGGSLKSLPHWMRLTRGKGSHSADIFVTCPQVQYFVILEEFESTSEYLFFRHCQT